MWFAAFFSILLCPSCKRPSANTPPGTPRFVMATTSIHTGSALWFNISVSDPEGDNVRVRFAWDDGDTSDWGEYSRYNWTGERSCVIADTYAVCVQAQDADGLLSDWAGPCSALAVTGGNLPPHTPILSGPDTVSLAAGDGFYVQVTVFEPEKESVSFKVDWGNGDVWPWGSYWEHGTSCIIPRTVPSPGTYIVRMRTRDTNLNESFWSPGHRIVVVP